MFTNILAQVYPGLTFIAEQSDDAGVCLHLAVVASTAVCPHCQTLAQRRHGKRTCTVHDLPLLGIRLRVSLHIRRFRCDNADCHVRTFSERLPAYVAPYAHRAVRLRAHLTTLAFAVGGEGGARLCHHLGYGVSASTVLRLMHHFPLLVYPQPRIVGIDDFAFRRGRTYGTVVMDLEKHQVIDVLPDRTAATVEAWFAAQPNVEIVSRDRAAAYGAAIRRAMPTVQQVADRWHILADLREWLKRLVERLDTLIQDCLAPLRRPAAPPSPPPRPTADLSSAPPVQPTPPPPHETGRQLLRQRRIGWYTAVKTLHAEGKTNGAIVQTRGLHPQTVRKYMRAAKFPERARQPTRPSRVAAYDALMRQCWDDGCFHTRTIWQRLQTAGYTGSFMAVYKYIRRNRDRLPRPPTGRSRGRVREPLPQRRASARQMSWWFVSRPEKLTPTQTRYLTTLRDTFPELAQAYRLAQTFGTLVRQRDRAGLDGWLEQVTASGIAAFVSFATGLRQDDAAVAASLGFAWSNGQAAYCTSSR